MRAFHSAVVPLKIRLSTYDLGGNTAAVLDNGFFSGSSGIKAGAAAASSFKNQIIEVQYNPSTISIQANAESITFSSMMKNVDANVPAQHSRPPSVTLTVDLIFDAMNAKDAFMLDKLSASPTAVTSSVSAAIQAGKGGYSRSEERRVGTEC